MPPRTPDEIELNRIHRLIGLFAISVIFLAITMIASRQGGPAVSAWLTWAFALLGLASLGGWIFLAARRVERMESLRRKLLP